MISLMNVGERLLHLCHQLFLICQWFHHSCIDSHHIVSVTRDGIAKWRIAIRITVEHDHVTATAFETFLSLPMVMATTVRTERANGVRWAFRTSPFDRWTCLWPCRKIFGARKTGFAIFGFYNRRWDIGIIGSLGMYMWEFNEAFFARHLYRSQYFWIIFLIFLLQRMYDNDSTWTKN